MNIANMKVAIRPMSTAQAIDLGAMMARHWFVPLWKIWIGMAFPIFIIFVVGFTFIDYKFGLSDSSIKSIGFLIFWWLKPFYEKPMLSWLGQTLFTNQPDIKQSVRQGWRTAKSFALPLLITKRLSPHRQLITPIAVLEKPDMSQLKQRASILSRGQGNGLGWHTIIMVHIESIIAVAVVLFLSQLVPTQFMSTEALLQYLEHSPSWFEPLWTTIYFFAASIVAPFYVASGFAVYLTKRCLLEGWDVELVFKQLRYRYEQSQSSPIAILKQPHTQSYNQDSNSTQASLTSLSTSSAANGWSRQVHSHSNGNGNNKSNSFLNNQADR